MENEICFYEDLGEVDNEGVGPKMHAFAFYDCNKVPLGTHELPYAKTMKMIRENGFTKLPARTAQQVQRMRSQQQKRKIDHWLHSCPVELSDEAREIISALL
jgi:hypothetical protein